MRLPLLAALALATVACGSTNPQTGTGGSSGTGGNGSTSSSSGSGGAGGSIAPVIDPALFDCTATKPPVRVNPIPVSCATDTACTTKLVSGHRGAGGELGVIAPEDSVAAVRAAIVLGLDFVETDPRPTKDGVIVNLHDPTVDRTTDGTGSVDALTYAEIQELHLRSPDTPGDFSCEHVPTLEEILTAARGKVHVLVDANKTDQVDLLVAAIQKTDTLDWAIFDTSSVDKIDAALAIEPKLHTMIRVTGTGDLDMQLAHFAAHPPVIVEIEKGTDAKVLAAAIHAAQNRALIDAFLSDVGAGISSDPSVYDEILATGVDMLQSDRPDLVLRNLGRWPPPPQP
ncbi:MAG: glycerophosphodiester phosphodiesterase family protein [Minicystis sp.]